MFRVESFESQMRDALAQLPSLSDGQDVIRPLSNPIKKTGHIQVRCTVATIVGIVV
jgi:hypothetical protein